MACNDVDVFIVPPNKQINQKQESKTYLLTQIEAYYTKFDGLDWLAGAGYNHLGFYIHGIEHKKPGGEVTKGTYFPVLFENIPSYLGGKSLNS